MNRGANGFGCNGNPWARQRTGVELSQSYAPVGRRGWRTTNHPTVGGSGVGPYPPWAPVATWQRPFRHSPSSPLPPFAFSCCGPTPSVPHWPRHTHSGSSGPLPDLAALGTGGNPPEHSSPSLLPLPAPARGGLSCLALGSPAQGDGRGLICIHPLARPVLPMGPQRPALPT